MRAWPTTTIDVWRGTVTDEFGDTVDIDPDTIPPVIHEEPAALAKGARNVYPQNSPTPQRVHSLDLRVDHDTDIRSGDRVRDNQSGTFYFIVDENTPSSIGYDADRHYSLRLVTA